MLNVQVIAAQQKKLMSVCTKINWATFLCVSLLRTIAWIDFCNEKERSTEQEEGTILASALPISRRAFALPPYIDHQPQRAHSEFITCATSNGAAGLCAAAAPCANVPERAAYIENYARSRSMRSCLTFSHASMTQTALRRTSHDARKSSISFPVSLYMAVSPGPAIFMEVGTSLR